MIEGNNFPYFTFRAQCYSSGSIEQRDEKVTAEEPLLIRLCDDMGCRDYATIMRTPVHDDLLALGFLFSEGVVKVPGDVRWMRYAGSEADKESSPKNALEVGVRSVPVGRAPRLVESSCGICGKASIESLVVEGFGVLNDRARFRASTVLSLPEKLRGEQRIFEETGGIHSAGLFDSNGEAIFSAEDVGRHNAVDKVIGFMLMNGIDGRGKALQVSGRAGFEIVQKAVRARISLVSSVSAPSSLAVDTALSFNLTLCGFVRQDRFNVYSGEERIEFDTVFYG